MRRIVQLAVFVLVGWAIAATISLDVRALSHSPGYRFGAYLLLAIGLYSATYGIDVASARADRRLIGSAVTVGVVVKALIIGGCLALAWQDPLFLVLGVAVAQIDPLSVAALMGDQRMSVRARTVLAAWSSFDDPFTVVLSIYAATVAANTFGLGDAEPTATDPVLLYGLNLGGNLLLAAGAWLIWRWARRRDWSQYLALAVFCAVSVLTGWMLAIAVIGLFARPAGLATAIPRVTAWALGIASIALGALLLAGMSLAQGVALGLAAFLAQAIVAWPLTRGMPRADRWHLALAQQNGITAIILALTLEIQFDGVVAVVAPAMIVTNLIHMVANKLVDRTLNHRVPETLRR